MEREDERPDLIDLGAVSTETKGPVGPRADELSGKFIEGLTDE